MAGKRKAPAKTEKKQQSELLFEDGYYWIVNGNKRLNVGRSHRYAQQMLTDLTAK
jgi:hypothetical protein